MVNVDLQNIRDKQLVLKHKIKLRSNEKYYNVYIEDGNSSGYLNGNVINWQREDKLKEPNDVSLGMKTNI